MFCGFISQRVNSLLFSHGDRQHYLQNGGGKPPKTGWIIINQMDFILKQTFLFCQTDFCFGKQLTLEIRARNCRLHYNSSLGAVQLQCVHYLALFCNPEALSYKELQLLHHLQRQWEMDGQRDLFSKGTEDSGGRHSQLCYHR